MYLLSSRCLRKSGSCLNSIKYWQSNFGVNLLSEVIPIDTEALLNAELSFSESPKYSILISPLSSGFKILVAKDQMPYLYRSRLHIHPRKDVNYISGYTS